MNIKTINLNDVMPPKGTTITITREMTKSERKDVTKQRIINIILDEWQIGEKVWFITTSSRYNLGHTTYLTRKSNDIISYVVYKNFSFDSSLVKYMSVNEVMSYMSLMQLLQVYKKLLKNRLDESNKRKICKTKN